MLTTSTTPGCADRGLPPRLRVADDHVGEVGTVEPAAVGALKVDGADLLDHAVEVVDPGQPGVVREAPPEHRRCRRPGRRASSSRRSGSGCRWTGPSHGCGRVSYRYSQAMNVKPKIRNGCAAMLGQETTDRLDVGLILLVEHEHVVATEVHQAEHARTPGRERVPVGEQRFGVDQQHRQPLGADHGLQRRPKASSAAPRRPACPGRSG